MGLEQKYKPFWAAISIIAAFVCVLTSSWHNDMSTAASVVVIVIGVVIILVTASFVLIESTERGDDDWKWRFGKQVVVCGVIMYLMDEFGERHPDIMLFAALIFSGFYIHFTAHTFRFLNDYGLSQGFVTVGATDLVHLDERRLLKMLAMVLGAVLLALYASFENWDDGTIPVVLSDIEQGGDAPRLPTTTVEVPVDEEEKKDEQEEKEGDGAKDETEREVERKKAEEIQRRNENLRKRKADMKQDKGKDEAKADQDEEPGYKSE
ncbi:unnamed protein product [Eruca vesicaria subsp. sativa]|uniref:Uncharacterized protein n=1 Tax=Eruca vesicaria subsp. sativa TaxID=29727 RepID=A0ABC8JDA0_ERUVS|nr:unnamed protein product [Eruca vesicaria subsp. sativa]